MRHLLRTARLPALRSPSIHILSRSSLICRPSQSTITVSSINNLFMKRGYSDMSYPDGGSYRGRGGGGGGRGRGGGGMRGRGGYGGGGRGGGGGGGGESLDAFRDRVTAGAPVTEKYLSELLRRIDGRSYGAYKDIMTPETPKYTWSTGIPFDLIPDKIQSDPFAPPSAFRVSVPVEALEIPKEIIDSKLKMIAFADYLNRNVRSLIRKWRIDVADGSGRHGFHGPKGGNMELYSPQQQVLERSSVVIKENNGNPENIELRFTITLPAMGRTIRGHKARELLTEHLPRIVDQGLHWSNQSAEKVETHIRSVAVQEALRNSLAEKGLVSFIGNGSVLPRRSGADPRPMEGDVVPFKSPPEMEVTIDTGIPDANGETIKVTGMGIPKGVTVIAGGGFHGKTTLLEAIELGIYNVVAGDGRELVVTDPNAFKIRAEDGRSVVSTDISAFIKDLPGSRSTTSFSTADASGSTSMAANIQESLEVGATTLIIDEDTSATNFLIRDRAMEELILVEPITPLISKVRALYQEKGVSTIIVTGGCGDYLQVADTVIGMINYLPEDWTTRAKEIVERHQSAITQHPTFGATLTRAPVLPSSIAQGKPPKAIERHTIGMKDTDCPDVDISYIEQFVEVGQVATTAAVISSIAENNQKGVKMSFGQWREQLEKAMEEKGCGFDGFRGGNRARARPLEILAAVNRVRKLRVEEPKALEDASEVRF